MSNVYFHKWKKYKKSKVSPPANDVMSYASFLAAETKISQTTKIFDSYLNHISDSGEDYKKMNVDDANNLLNLYIRKIFYSNYVFNNGNNITDQDYKNFNKILYRGSESKIFKSWPHLVESESEIKDDAKEKKILRVGYVSGDFYHHVCMSFFTNLLNDDAYAVKNNKIEEYLYSNAGSSDMVTDRIINNMKWNKNQDSRWRNICKMNTFDVIKLIHQDKIDILIDLTGFTSSARLDVFGLQAAPLQISWLGYANTTGLSTIQYRITDTIADPIDTQQYFSEKLAYINRIHKDSESRTKEEDKDDKVEVDQEKEKDKKMEDQDCSFLCFDPNYFGYPEITVKTLNDLPYYKINNGRHITFGSFNNASKLSDETIICWSKVMKKNPKSRLCLSGINVKNLSPSTISYIKKRFKTLGAIRSHRIIIQPFSFDQDSHYKEMENIDIALDSFPYSGTTTTLDTLMMGIPLITLKTNPDVGGPGHIHSHNVSASIMHRIPSVKELIASSPEEFVAISVRLANDAQKRLQYRQTLRQNVKESTICNSAFFRQKFDQLLLNLWDINQQTRENLHNDKENTRVQILDNRNKIKNLKRKKFD